MRSCDLVCQPSPASEIDHDVGPLHHCHSKAEAESAAEAEAEAVAEAEPVAETSLRQSCLCLNTCCQVFFTFYFLFICIYFLPTTNISQRKGVTKAEALGNGVESDKNAFQLDLHPPTF